IPVLAVAGLVWLFVLIRQGKLKGARPPWRAAGIVLAILFGTCALMKFDVPRRIAFAKARSAFEQLLPRASASNSQGIAGRAVNLRLGIYHVDRFAADPRGGVYFRVHSGADGLGPDVKSYGFAYQPNPQGTPFG